MRKSRTVQTATDPAELNEQVTLRAKEEEAYPVKSLNFSPERIMEGASATTEVLSEILAQRDMPHQLRHWGLNE